MHGSYTPQNDKILRLLVRQPRLVCVYYIRNNHSWIVGRISNIDHLTKYLKFLATVYDLWPRVSPDSCTLFWKSMASNMVTRYLAQRILGRSLLIYQKSNPTWHHRNGQKESVQWQKVQVDTYKVVSSSPLLFFLDYDETHQWLLLWGRIQTRWSKCCSQQRSRPSLWTRSCLRCSAHGTQTYKSKFHLSHTTPVDSILVNMRNDT